MQLKHTPDRHLSQSTAASKVSQAKMQILAELQRRRKNAKLLKKISVVGGVAFIVLVSVLVVWLAKDNKAAKTSSTSDQLIADTIKEVGQIMLLPPGEQPTLAVVNDVSKYEDNEFFKNAANGDRLLVYAQARQAVLYRPSIHKIIAVAPINADAAQ